MQIIIKIKKLYDYARMPILASENAACFDLHAALDHPVHIPAQHLVDNRYMQVIGCGFSMELHPDYEAIVRPRSSISLTSDLCIVNSPGTIDSDYRGEIKVVLANRGKRAAWINNGDPIAQMAIRKKVHMELKIVDELSRTKREKHLK